MKTSLIALAVSCVLPICGLSQGTVNFQNRSGVGQGKPIYEYLPSNPLEIAIGDSANYAGREKIAGSQYIAGLFVEREGLWSQVATSAFRTGVDAGFIFGASRVTIEGTQGGDVVNLQIRVWDSKISSWDDAMHSESLIGISPKIENYVLGGLKEGIPVLQKSLIEAGLESFALFYVPEPSILAFGAAGLMALYHPRRGRK